MIRCQLFLKVIVGKSTISGSSQKIASLNHSFPISPTLIHKKTKIHSSRCRGFPFDPHPGCRDDCSSAGDFPSWYSPSCANHAAVGAEKRKENIDLLNHLARLYSTPPRASLSFYALKPPSPGFLQPCVFSHYHHPSTHNVPSLSRSRISSD